MINLVIIAVVVGVIVFIVELFEKGGNESADDSKERYKYSKKKFFMTRAEREFYNVLVSAVGNDYYVFAQVHLPTIIDHKIVGQNWRGAFRHIDEKSVDYVLCDKVYISPKLAIELDDYTHDRSNRKARDEEVERILKAAGLPLLRIQNHGHFDASELKIEIEKVTDKRAEYGLGR